MDIRRQRCSAFRSAGPDVFPVSVDDRRLRSGAREPADAVRFDGRPARAARVFQAGLVFIFGSLLCSVAPSLGWLVVFRMLQAVGGSMLNPMLCPSSQHLHRTTGTARAIGLGWVIGSAWAGPVSVACCRDGRLAVHLLDQHPDRPRRDRPHRSLRPRVEGTPRPAGGPCRPAAGDRGAGEPDLRDHRGAAGGLDVADDAGPARVGARRDRDAAGLRAAPGRSAARAALLPQRPVLRRDGDRDQCVRRVLGLPVPEYAVPAGRARVVRPCRQGCARCRWR